MGTVTSTLILIAVFTVALLVITAQVIDVDYQKIAKTISAAKNTTQLFQLINKCRCKI